LHRTVTGFAVKFFVLVDDHWTAWFLAYGSERAAVEKLKIIVEA
jgi:hypothetical protein